MIPLEKSLRKPGFVLTAILLAVGMSALYVYTQVLGNLGNVDVWVANIPPEHGILFGIFSLVFGITTSYQIQLWKSPKTCPVGKQAKGGSAGGVGTIGIFLVAQCPACASLGALFLPVSAIALLTQYAVWINLASIGLLLFTLHYLGAFEKVK